MARKEKVYCEGTCGDSSFTYRGFHSLPVSKHNNTVWVHTCGKPSLAIWESFIEPCEECFSDFSSPWELLCKKCWKQVAHRSHVESLSEPMMGDQWRGWTWARLTAQADSEALVRNWRLAATVSEPISRTEKLSAPLAIRNIEGLKLPVDKR